MEELEQAAQDHYVKFWFSEPSPASSFISGAEWAKERMFTEEEVTNYAFYFMNTIENTEIMPLAPKEWKENLKNENNERRN